MGRSVVSICVYSLPGQLPALLEMVHCGRRGARCQNPSQLQRNSSYYWIQNIVFIFAVQHTTVAYRKVMQVAQVERESITWKLGTETNNTFPLTPSPGPTHTFQRKVEINIWGAITAFSEIIV